MGYQFGRRSELLSLPIACAILFLGFYNILSASGSIILLFLDLGSPKLHSATTKTLCLFRATMGLVWGISAASNVALFKRWAGLARFTLILNAAQVIPWLATFIYILTFIASASPVPSPYTWGVMQALCVWLCSGISLLLFRYPYEYSSWGVWIGITIFSLIEIIFILLTVDLSWSYFNVLFYGGTGWENKAYQNLYGDEEDEYFDYEEGRRLV